MLRKIGNLFHLQRYAWPDTNISKDHAFRRDIHLCLHPIHVSLLIFQELMELLDLTITDATMLIEQSKLSPLELTRAYLERIEKLDPLLHCFIIVSTESALQSAEKAENAIQRGPLHGIPIALKDMFETKGVRTKACALGSGCV